MFEKKKTQFEKLPDNTRFSRLVDTQCKFMSRVILNKILHSLFNLIYLLNCITLRQWNHIGFSAESYRTTFFFSNRTFLVFGESINHLVSDDLLVYGIITLVLLTFSDTLYTLYSIESIYLYEYILFSLCHSIVDNVRGGYASDVMVYHLQ